MTSRMIRLLTIGGIATALIVGLAGATHPIHDLLNLAVGTNQLTPMPTTSAARRGDNLLTTAWERPTSSPASLATTCPISYPGDPSAYASAFAALPIDQWGAADGAITVPFYGRSIWLFGDTMSARPNGFVHSTAITQDRGCFHVSNGGAQLLPNDDAQHVYWIESGRPIDATHLAVTGRAITLTGTGMFDFADGGTDRTATVTVSPGGDLTFTAWTSQRTSPTPDPGPQYCTDPDHWCYARHTHPELPLTDGAVLVSTSQNWSNSWDAHRYPDGGFRWTDYQPMFTEQPAPVIATTHVSVYCHENTGQEFRIGAYPYSHRVDRTHVHLAFYSKLAVNVRIYTEAGYVATALYEPAGLFGITIPASQPHNWTAGSAAWRVSQDWVSSRGLGNHCGSNLLGLG